MSEPEKPKIFVDSDWKSQAKAEKEKLAAAEQEKAGKMGEKERRDQGAPQADFQALLGTLITQALMYMGAFPDPETGKAVVSLEYARFHIDLLGVLEQKCKGNLTEQESKDLGQALHELRSRYVELTHAVARMAEKQQAQQGGGGGTGGAGQGFGGTSGPIGPGTVG